MGLPASDASMRRKLPVLQEVPQEPAFEISDELRLKILNRAGDYIDEMIAKELEVKIRVFPEGDEPFEIEIVEMEEEILDEHISDEDLALQKPKHRSQCVDGYRPCPWVSCRYNLFLDIRQDGILRLNFPGKEPEDMYQSCALDLAEDGPRTLEQVAIIMGMSKERARQIEDAVMKKLRPMVGKRTDTLDDIL